MSRPGLASAAVAAAFLGPGTIRTCTRAGASYGCTLLWVLAVSLVILLIAQLLCVRLGAVAGVSLSEGLRRETPAGPIRWLVSALVLGAVGIGCAAYQAGNLKGATQGLLAVAPLAERTGFFLCSGAAVLLLTIRRREVLLGILVGLVALMTACFCIAGLRSGVSWSDVSQGLQPSLPGGLEAREAFLLVAGLVGTTIVPYNLFLHSSLVRDRVAAGSDHRSERRDLWLFLPLGVVISMLVMITSAGALYGSGEIPAELHGMALALERPMGASGQWVFGLGLLAAGLSSAITAPLAAGLAVSQLFAARSASVARTVTWLVMACGVLSFVLGGSPSRIIDFAQITNSMLLPVALGFLVWVCTRRNLLGEHRSGPVGVGLGIVAVAASLMLAVRTMLQLLSR